MNNKSKICIEVKKEIIEKARYICDTENITLRSIAEYSFSEFIKEYEKKYGEITQRKLNKKKGDVNNLLKK